MDGELQGIVDSIVKNSPEVQWSVFLGDDREAVASHDPDKVLSTASVGKLLLLMEVARRFDNGGLSPDATLARSDDLAVTDSGLWQHLRTSSFPAEDLAVLVASVSDNLATNVLLHEVGLRSVQAGGSQVGLQKTALLDRVRSQRGDGDPSHLSEGSSRELAGFMGLLGAGDLVSEAVSAHMRRWLAINVDLSMVAASFGLDPLAHADEDRGLVLLNKTGTDVDVRADVGYLAGPRRHVSYAVIANWADDIDQRDSVLDGMRTIGGALRTLVE